MEFILKHPEYNWNWWNVSMNPNVTMEFIEKHPEYDWDWGCVSQNPNVTMEFIESHPEYDWNWESISLNKFKLHPHFNKFKFKNQYNTVLEQLEHNWYNPYKTEFVHVE
jgi:hypothetical protein